MGWNSEGGNWGSSQGEQLSVSGDSNLCGQWSGPPLGGLIWVLHMITAPSRWWSCSRIWGTVMYSSMLGMGRCVAPFTWARVVTMAQLRAVHVRSMFSAATRGHFLVTASLVSRGRYTCIRACVLWRIWGIWGMGDMGDIGDIGVIGDMGDMEDMGDIGGNVVRIASPMT